MSAYSARLAKTTMKQHKSSPKKTSHAHNGFTFPDTINVHNLREDVLLASRHVYPSIRKEIQVSHSLAHAKSWGISQYGKNGVNAGIENPLKHTKVWAQKPFWEAELRNSPMLGMMGAASVWMTSTNWASLGSSRTNSGVPSKQGSAGSKPKETRCVTGLSAHLRIHCVHLSQTWVQALAVIMS